MMEGAPSGIYLEEWRFQESAPGVLAALRLLSETDHAGNTRPRDGGLMIAGDHAIRVLGRRAKLPDGTRCQDFVRRSENPVAALEQILDCKVDYVRRENGLYAIMASTDPRREGQTLDLMSRFMPGPADRQLIELLDDDRELRSRLWQIDSLELVHRFAMTTAVAEDRLAWLARESDTLIDPISSPSRSLARCA
jgi:hypothetical protein